MPLKAKKLLRCFYDAGYWTIEHDGIEHAGYLAFLGMLSLFPFLVFFVAIAGLIGQAHIGIEFAHLFEGYLPERVLDAIQPRIDEIISGPPQGLLTVAIIGVIWTASSAVEGTRTILNRAYRVETPPAYIWRRLRSIAEFLGLTAIIIIAMLLLIFAPIVLDTLEVLLGWEKLPDPLWEQLGYGLSGLVVFLGVATSYYILPNIQQKWTAVMPGTALVVLGWLGAAELLTAYFQNFNQVNLVYGSLGGIIATLLFFYVLSVIYIFGAEFNYFLERAMGHRIIQKEEVEKDQ